HFLYNNGRWPIILAKSTLFKVPFLGHAIRELCAIPVHRGSSDAVKSLHESSARLKAGGAILFYPEGTCTRDPDLWPMVGKTGAALLAMGSGAKVTPVPHGGAHELPPYGPKKRTLFPRKTFRASVPEPVHLSKYAGQPPHAPVLRETT